MESVREATQMIDSWDYDFQDQQSSRALLGVTVHWLLNGWELSSEHEILSGVRAGIISFSSSRKTNWKISDLHFQNQQNGVRGGVEEGTARKESGVTGSELSGDESEQRELGWGSVPAVWWQTDGTKPSIPSDRTSHRGTQGNLNKGRAVISAHILRYHQARVF